MHNVTWIFFIILLFSSPLPILSTPTSEAAEKNSDSQSSQILLTASQKQKGYKVALFAGGCFWCLEPPYEELDGVIEATVGYCGGSSETASYYKVSSGATNHLETVRLVYNPNVVSYTQLLDIYWRFIDPTDSEGQYDDRGPQYTTAIFYNDQSQKLAAEKSKSDLIASRKHEKLIVTAILPAVPFYLAEEKHQNFYEKRFSTKRPAP